MSGVVPGNPMGHFGTNPLSDRDRAAVSARILLIAVERSIMRSDVLGITRRSIIVGASALSVGCVGNGSDGKADGSPSDDEPDEPPSEGDGIEGSGTEDGNPATGELTDMGTITLTSPAFGDGERIPRKYGYDAENVNPPLEIRDVPEEAETLALIVDDPDALEPAGKVWDHWIVWNIPPDLTTIPEGWNPEKAEEGTNDFGEVGYGGPSPPDTEHRYRFKLFALETELELPVDTDAEALGSAMDGHVLERTQLDGTYPA